MRLFRYIPALLGALALMVAMHGPAFAHAVLMSSTPVEGGTVAVGHADLTLHYNSRIDSARSTAILTGPDHVKHQLQPVAGAAPEDVRIGTDLSAPGAYMLRWQVLAVDGHITRGDLNFIVKAP